MSLLNINNLSIAISIKINVRPDNFLKILGLHFLPYLAKQYHLVNNLSCRLTTRAPVLDGNIVKGVILNSYELIE